MAQTVGKKKSVKHLSSKHIFHAARIGFWFSTGAILSLFFVSSFSFLLFEKINEGRIYPGVIVSGKNLGGETQKEAEKFFLEKNDKLDTNFTFTLDGNPIATVSAKDIDFGYDERLLTSQAMTLGRSKNILSNIYIISKAFTSGIYLPPAYRYSQEKLMKILTPFLAGVEKQPVEALFSFENGKVTTFKPSSEGQTLDRDSLDQELLGKGITISTLHPKSVIIAIPIKTIKPKLTTESVNNFGIKELIATGTSTFYHSIQSRIYNIGLAASRLNGVLVPPDEVFSFDKALGDVTSLTGYQ
ncbi:MAG TPA: peptidoglycan binding domain-containing protein, partial [Patescibacteria group bacterium]|nr:peptidoglycan binding domain-containing protein [Patescibacteria group bacterium]